MRQQELRNALTSTSCLREVPRQAREKHTWVIKPGPPLLDTANLHQETKCKRLWILFLFFPALHGENSLSLTLYAPFKAIGASVPLLQSLSSLLISIMQNAQLPVPMQLQEEIHLFLPFSS